MSAAVLVRWERRTGESLSLTRGNLLTSLQGVDAMKADFFRHFLGFERVDVSLDGPGNVLLLDRSRQAGLGWDRN